MRLKFVLILMTAVFLVSCNSIDKVANNSPNPAGPQITYADGAKRITIDEFDTLMKNGQAFVVDVRNQASYDIGHIPGSRLIPAGDILNHVNELPRDKMIVTYCA